LVAIIASTSARRLSSLFDGIFSKVIAISHRSYEDRRGYAPADDLRDEAALAKREAEATSDPKKKQRLKKIAEDDKAKAIDIEDDVA
jgi:hypothetical protein